GGPFLRGMISLLDRGRGVAGLAGVRILRDRDDLVRAGLVREEPLDRERAARRLRLRVTLRLDDAVALELPGPGLADDVRVDLPLHLEARVVGLHLQGRDAGAGALALLD